MSNDPHSIRNPEESRESKDYESFRSISEHRPVNVCLEICQLILPNLEASPRNVRD